MNRLSWSMKGYVRRLPVAWKDARINRRWVQAGKRFLVVRHAARQPYFYGDFLLWVAANFPDLRPLFELRLLPCRVRDKATYLLHIPWLQDPLGHWSPRGYAQALRLTADCDRLGIPIVNRVDRHRNTSKAEGARRIARAGLRTPRMIPITDAEEFRTTLCGLEPPLLVRENNGHGGSIHLVQTRADAARVPLKSFRTPLAIEFIDVRDAVDGLYRRYRYVVVDDIGISFGLHISPGWESRARLRVDNESTRTEEVAFILATNPHHAQFMQAQRLLELDVVAFDYSYDQKGQIVVWEANLYPNLHYPTHPGRQHLRGVCDKTFAAMLGLYLRRAGLDTPRLLRELAMGDVTALPRAA